MMEEVEEAGYRTEEAVSARKLKLDYFAERIGLGGLYGEKHSRRMKVTVNGHVVEREMHGGVEGGRGRSELAHAQKTKPGSTEGRSKHGVVKVGEVQRRTNQQHKVLSDRKARRSNGALLATGHDRYRAGRALGVGWQLKGPRSPSQFAENERRTSSSLWCRRTQMMPSAPRTSPM